MFPALRALPGLAGLLLRSMLPAFRIRSGMAGFIVRQPHRSEMRR